MTKLSYLVGLACMLLIAPLHAEQQAPQTIRVIPKTYISPGASGSVSGSQHYESHNLYGGQRLPGDGTLERQESYQGSQSIESRGGIRQSIEYPNGYEVQRLPGQSSQTYQRSR